MSSGSIFIVHSDKDLNPAMEIAKMLKKAGADVWMESINLKNISPEEDEDELIEKAILSSELVAVITSKHALSDDWVKNQKGFASDNGKNLFLIKVAPCEADKKLRWRNIPITDFQSDKQAAIETILERVGISPAETKDVEAKSKSKTLETTQTNHADASKEASAKSKDPSEESAMLEELKEDFEFYKFKLKEQIKNSRFNKILGVSIALVLVAVAIFVPDLVEAIQGIQDKVQWAGGFVGGGLPTTFSGLNLNTEKVNKERLRGVQTFERRLIRMERGQISFTKNDIFALEDEFKLYIDA
ncbi:toll/interleukin-1 receptor domain-containing protein [Flavobacteriaceae bacterium D16]|nr:toll/interleukin-1 receptor domain-containing protein [Flavobacteriaceae bacterium D16]